jgi:hypothetical protein
MGMLTPSGNLRSGHQIGIFTKILQVSDAFAPNICDNGRDIVSSSTGKSTTQASYEFNRKSYTYLTVIFLASKPN